VIESRIVATVTSNARKARRKIAADPIHLELRVDDVGARRQPGDCRPPSRPVGVELDGFTREPPVGGGRRPHLDLFVGEEKLRWHHPDDREVARSPLRGIVDAERPTDDIRRPVEPSLPKTVADDDDGSLVSLVCRRDGAAHERTGAEHGEQVSRHGRAQ
jgi:hypothetical protein